MVGHSNALHHPIAVIGVLAITAFTILASSFISGTFGMAGGMVLLGVLLVYFPVTTAMVLFSIIQFVANAWRAMLWGRFVRWPIFIWYAVGGVVAFAIMRAIAYVPDKATVYLALGAMPFAVEALPATARPNIEWRGVPFITGFLTTVVQFLAGVGGPFLDVFFQKSMLDRKTTLASKATVQTFSHVLRGAYFGSFGTVQTFEQPWWLLRGRDRGRDRAGTSLTPLIIERMTDHGFRQWTRAIILTVSGIYLVRGAVLFWRGLARRVGGTTGAWATITIGILGITLPGHLVHSPACSGCRCASAGCCCSISTCRPRW